MKKFITAIPFLLFTLNAQNIITCKENEILFARKCYKKVPNCDVQTNKSCFKCDQKFSKTVKGCVKDPKYWETKAQDKKILSSGLYNSDVGFITVKKIILQKFPTFKVDHVAKVQVFDKKTYPESSDYNVYFTLSDSDDVYEVGVKVQMMNPSSSKVLYINKNDTEFEPLMSIMSPSKTKIRLLQSQSLAPQYRKLTLEQVANYNKYIFPTIQEMKKAFPQYLTVIRGDTYQQNNTDSLVLKIQFNFLRLKSFNAIILNIQRRQDGKNQAKFKYIKEKNAYVSFYQKQNSNRRIARKKNN